MHEKESLAHHIVEFYLDLFLEPFANNVTSEDLQFKRIPKRKRLWMVRPRMPNSFCPQVLAFTSKRHYARSDGISQQRSLVLTL